MTQRSRIKLKPTLRLRPSGGGGGGASTAGQPMGLLLAMTRAF